MGITVRFRVLLRKCSSEGIGSSLPACASHPYFRTGFALPGFSTLSIPSGATRTTFPPAVWSPFRVCSRRFCRTPLGASTSPGRFLPFGASVPRESTYPRRSQLRVTVRVQGFSPSARLAPPTASRVYFTPQTPFGFTLQGIPLPRSCDSSSLPPCRLAVLPRLRSRRLEWRAERRTSRHP